MVRGTFRAKVPRRNPVRMLTPLSWVGPESPACRSILMTPSRPRPTRAVIRDGFPNRWWPRSYTARPLTCPTASPSVATWTTPSAMSSWVRSSERPWRRCRAASAAVTCRRPMASAPSRRAWKSASLWRSAEIGKATRESPPPAAEMNRLLEHGRHPGPIHGQDAPPPQPPSATPRGYRPACSRVREITESKSARTLKILEKSASRR